jgi:multiple sugar transport system permease protein
MTVLMKLATARMQGRDMTAETQIFHDSDADRGPPRNGGPRRMPSMAVLILWAVICLFPIYWTVTTSFKMAPT